MSTAILLWGVLFSALGLGYFIYGRKQRMAMPLACGVGLMLFPYFVGNAWVLAGVGAVLAALPWFIRV